MSKLPNVNKMTILGFSDSRMTRLIGVFVIPINPSSFHLEQEPDNSSLKMKFLKFDILMDNTGVVMGNILDGVPIALQLQGLMQVISSPNNLEPRPLRIVNGSTSFNCKLFDIKVKHILANNLGTTTRAKVNLIFEISS